MNILMVLGRNVEQDEMMTLPFLLLVLSPFVIFHIDYALILCSLCKSDIVWNILMILGIF